jgi:DNA processing protein
MTTSLPILTPFDPAYPETLRHALGAPPLLFAAGDLSLLKHPCIAIVGARHATADGIDNAYAFAAHLSARGWCVVSGLAHGIDAASHRGALSTGKAGGRTIAVLGTGIDVIYPKSHDQLVGQILDTNGLLISEFPPGTPPLKHNFPKRNRIVAGLCQGVLVVEAALRSGSLITARLANEMGREVFAIPGSIHSPLSRGPHQLIQQGAKLVECAADILCELACASVATPVDRHTQQAKEIKQSKPSSPLWDAIGYDPVSEDTVLRRSGLSISDFSYALLDLELQGVIARRSDGCISRVRP